MKPLALSHTRTRCARGFTLIEMLVTVAVLAILAAIAYPSYLAQIHKSGRLDALVALSQVQQAQERWRSSNTSFAADLAALGLPSQAGGRYSIAIRDSAAHGYTVVATAVASQAADTGCASLSLVQESGQTMYGSTGSAASRACWNR